MNTENIIAKNCARFAELCYSHAKLVVTVSAIMLAALISQAPNIPIDMSTEGMLHRDDPVRLNYDEFKRIFGRDDIIVMSMPITGELDHAFFSTLYSLQEEIETNVPFVDKVTSLINARVTKGIDDELIVEDLLEEWTPENQSHLIDSKAIKEFVLAQPHYVNRLISDDGKYTALIIEQTVFGKEKLNNGSFDFLTQAESSKTVNALKAIAEKNPELQISLGGKPIVINIINFNTLRDSSMAGTAAIVMSMLFMMFFFRRRSGVLLPLLVILGSIIGAMGAMGTFHAPFTLTIGAVFPLMVAVGVADAVHILSHFYRNYEESGDKRQAIIKAISDSGPAVLMTSLTTAAGFLSFTVGDLASTANLGIYAAVAVLFALYFTLMLLPAFIALFDIKQHSTNKQVNKNLESFLQYCGDMACKYPRIISLSSIALMVICIAGTTLLHFYYDPISRFPDHIIEKQDTYKIDSDYKGISPIEVIIDTGEPRGLLKPGILEKVEFATKRLSHTTILEMPLESSYSVLNILRETHKALNNNDPDYYKIAKDKQLIAQELLLFEMNNANDLRAVIDNELQRLRITLKTKHADGVEYQGLIAELQKELDAIFQDDAKATVTGAIALMAASVPKALVTMSNSYIVAGIVIILMMMAMVRSIGIGIISIVPNLLPILMVLNVLVIMDWPLDMTSILVGAIAMGIVVDDTLHFLYHFKARFNQSHDAREAVKHTLRMTGPALFITTIVFSTGAGGNMFSSIENIFIFGFTMWLVTILALLADIIATPALLVWVYGNKHDEL